MEKNCEYYMDEYLSLDKGERIPFRLTLHLLFCSKCRSEVRALSKAEKAAGMSLKIPTPVTDESITSIMKKIDPSYSPEKNHVPLFQWIIAGLIMIAALFFFGVYTSSSTNQLSLVVFYLVFAAAVTSYCMLFVGTNLDFFVKMINSSKQG